jgi:hypothetical protein
VRERKKKNLLINYNVINSENWKEPTSRVERQAAKKESKGRRKEAIYYMFF